MASGSSPTNRCSKASNPSIVSPEPRPKTPSSVSTRTLVTGNVVRGTGSHAAANGGSSGTTSRASRTAVMRIRWSIAQATRCGTVAPPGGSTGESHQRRVASAMVEGAHQAAVVEFDHVTKHYDVSAKDTGKGTPGAVNDLSMHIPAGKICCLVGPSGCGKTTSLKMVNRLIEPTSG